MPKLLVGYDVEAFAIGEGLAQMGDHGLAHAVDPASTTAALEIIRRNHEEFEAPATLFICGRTLVHHVEDFEPFVDHPLFDLQQHTYSHALVKQDSWRGGVFRASPPAALETELRTTSDALARYLDVECIGLRTPHGHHLGVSDAPDVLDVLERVGIRFVSSWGRNSEGGNPTPLSVQPFWYSEQGHPEILEIPFQHWLDGFWFEEYGIDRGHEFAEVLRAGIDEIVTNDWVYGACFHDWTMLRYDERGTGWVRSMLQYASESDVEIMSYADFHRSMPAPMAVPA